MATIINAPVKAAGTVTYPKLRVILDSLQFTIDSLVTNLNPNRTVATDSTGALISLWPYTASAVTFDRSLYAANNAITLGDTGSPWGTIVGTGTLTMTATFGNDGRITLMNFGGGSGTIINATSGNRTFTLPETSGTNPNFVITEAAQTINGAKTFSSALTVTPTSNQLVLGSTRTVTLTAPTPATSSRVITFPDLVGDYSVVGTIGTQTIAGAKTFSDNLSLVGDIDISSGKTTGFIIGADNGATTRTNNTAKRARISCYNYTNASAPISLLYCLNDGTNNDVYLGGGTLTNYAATGLHFMTAANATTAVGTEALTIDSSQDIYTVPWQDYSGSSTVVGFSATSTKLIYYKKIGKLVFVNFQFIGTSNSTSFTFTLPYSNNGNILVRNHCYTVDAGTIKTVGRFNLPVSSNTVTIATDQTGTGWTNDGVAGNKQASGNFWYQTT